ncbi:MAG: hypothetical protein KVP17_004464 [Porospora cf. gigantea B]|uniref:uncharacterized protein n=1 Tax=Porospora cf. gigantea B TaxID=2853592 RepID=UPI0035719344|nr:MAG: hypothetical protein KVP17_004464 [Porospora cf. gigantea B]
MATALTAKRPEELPVSEGPLTTILKSALERVGSNLEEVQLRGLSELWGLVLIPASDELYSEQFVADPTSVSRLQELALDSIMNYYVTHSCTTEILQSFEKAYPLFETLPKAKTAKIIRQLIDIVATLDESFELQEEVCRKVVEWCRREKRTFLRHRVETRLAQVYLKAKKYMKGVEFLKPLCSEVKRIDDKVILVEIYLIESKMHFAVHHYPKAKAALTSCRTVAAAINVAPLVQADIDLTAGILSAAEKDYRTGSSYLLEAFEAFNQGSDPRAMVALKYMMLLKLIQNNKALDEIKAITTSKNALKYTGREVYALLALAKCHEERLLGKFEETLKEYADVLMGDEVFVSHLAEVKERMLETNITRILVAYSRIDLRYVADELKLPEAEISHKISEMILDKKIFGRIDQSSGHLTLTEEEATPSLYKDCIDTHKNLADIVDVLYTKYRQHRQ